MVELLHIPYSPWSEKARWALEQCGVTYVSRLYQPLLGELALRRVLRRFRGPVSVPVLVDGDTVLGDSLDIARYAAQRARGAELFPPGKEADVERYNALSERGLVAGRAIMLARMLGDQEALAEMVPRKLRGKLGPLAPVIATVGVKRTLRKYGGHTQAAAEHQRVLCEVLDTLRADLAHAFSQPATLLGRFSYADIAMAQVLVFVRPPETGIKLGAATRRIYGDPALAERYQDLVAWRDALYAAHRVRT